MGVKPGYKQTEVGVIPEDWEIRPLAYAVEFLDMQRRPIKSSDRIKMAGIYPYYGASGIIDYVNGYLFDEDLILLGEDGENILSRTVRLAFRVSGKIWVNNHAHVLRPKLGIDIGYITEYLESIDYEEYNSGTAQPKLNRQTCLRIPVALPPLSEQTAIATALSDADALLQSLERLIAKKRDIKQGAMQELLTGKKRLPGFEKREGYKQTEVGVIPEDWEVKRLGDISHINMGQSPYSEFYSQSENGLPLIQGNADIKERKTIQRVWTTHITKTCDIGDILLTVRAPVGSVGIASENSCVGRGVCSLKPIDIDKSYLFFILIFSEGRWKSLEQGSTFTAANSTQIADFPLIISPINAEQSTIATIISDMDAEIATLDSKLAKAHQIKQGMMQELLTGRIRLT